ncbi:biogenesis of lysosome-related organelles complex 1 subunit 2 [Battus philenor]|uniref:biogenesis of lysosome-related organelles complex 1 subunit 2 n=1 Tax=Battus philenor TaxID=42288 RepID=UPI0035CF9432
MSHEEVDKWAMGERNKDVLMSPSHSSLEILDPHDPVLSRLATQMFKRTNDYLQGEMVAGQEHYILLEKINRLVITKYADLRSLSVNLTKTINDYNEMYDVLIKPLLQQIDEIDAQVSQIEVFAYQIDSYSKQLKKRFKELEEI